MSVEAPRAKAIFLDAVGRYEPHQWPQYLSEACAGDDELRRRVEVLLRAHAESAGLLDALGHGSVPTVDLDPGAERVGSSIGPYRLMERIGEGGMGVVYVAEQTKPVRRRVALKVIKPGMDTKQVIARFEAERQALAMMDHPNIAHVLDVGATESGRPYFVMELVRGIPITDYCDRERLSLPERLELFVLVCRAVQHAHQKGVIHRDLKPSNILVTVIDGAAVPRIIDFGVAKATGASLTERTIYTSFHQFVGTPLYMSPEQADLSGMDVDTRSDTYALGVLLYELLTGTTPFDQETFRQAAFDELRRIIREQEPPKPSTRLSSLGAMRATVSANRKADARQLDRAVRGELDWIVMKALEKDRRRRYETANDFAVDVMRYLTDKPVEACPPSVWYRFRKFTRRNRAALMTATLVAFILLIGTAVSAWQALRATAAEHRVSTALLKANASYRVAEARRVEAVNQERETKTLLARSLIRSGVERLEGGSALGLFDLIDAHAAAEHDPALREAEARLWAVGFAPLEDQLVWVLAGGGRALDFSPDGALLATAEGHQVRFWETSTGRGRGAPLEHGPDSPVANLLFSPDGTRLATTMGDETVRLWEVATGRTSETPLRTGTTRDNLLPGSLAFSPDGQLLTAWAPDGEVRLWNTTTGRPHGPILHHPRMVHHVRFSPDGNLLATGSIDGAARLWDVKSGALVRSLLGGKGRMPALQFSPDGLLLAVSDALAITRLWEVTSGQLHCAPLETNGWVDALAFSPDGQWLATGDAGWTVQVWNTATGRPRGNSLRHGGRVRSVGFSPDGRLLASTSEDALVRLWDMTTQQAHGYPLPSADVVEGISHPPSTVKFSPDGKLLAVGHSKTTRVWRVDQREWAGIFEHTDPVRAIDLNYDGTRLATASGSKLSLWETGTGRRVSHPLSGIDMNSKSANYVGSPVAFNPAGTLLAVITSPKTVRLLDPSTGDPVGQPLTHDGGVQAVTFSPDGKRLATTSGSPGILLWDPATQSQDLTLHQPEGGLLCLAFSPDGQHLAAGCGTWRASVWNLAGKPNLTRTWGVHGWCLGLSYRPDGRWLATGSMEGIVRLWDSATGEPQGPGIRLAGPIAAMEFSPDGKVLATAARDAEGLDYGPVRLWDLTVTPPYPYVALPQSGGTECLSFSGDGRWLAIGLKDGTARLLRLPELPTTTREMRLRTWIALGTRISQGEAQALPLQELQALRDEIRALRRDAAPMGTVKSPRLNRSWFIEDSPKRRPPIIDPFWQ
jgi:WD40 repeat protein/serine/threonine protein kinase